MDKDETNITVFTSAIRDSLTNQFVFFGASRTPATEDQFSQPDIDDSLDCLAANISTNLNYIIVFPVACSASIANSFQCFLHLGIIGANISVYNPGKQIAIQTENIFKKYKIFFLLLGKKEPALVFVYCFVLSMRPQFSFK